MDLEMMTSDAILMGAGAEATNMNMNTSRALSEEADEERSGCESNWLGVGVRLTHDGWY